MTTQFCPLFCEYPCTCNLFFESEDSLNSNHSSPEDAMNYEVQINSGYLFGTEDLLNSRKPSSLSDTTSYEGHININPGHSFESEDFPNSSKSPLDIMNFKGQININTTGKQSNRPPRKTTSGNRAMKDKNYKDEFTKIIINLARQCGIDIPVDYKFLKKQSKDSENMSKKGLLQQVEDWIKKMKSAYESLLDENEKLKNENEKLKHENEQLRRERKIHELYFGNIKEN